MSRPVLLSQPRFLIRSILLSLSLAGGLVALHGSTSVESRVGAAGAGQITVAGYPYSGDTFVFVIDHSGSMGWQGDMAVVKAVVTEALAALDSSVDFSLVAFSTDTAVFSSTALPATFANRNAGIDWLNALVPDGATCMLNGLVSGLDVLSLSGATGTSGSMLVFADGSPNCLPDPQETLDGTLAANGLGIPIHTFLPPGQNSDPVLAGFLQALSSQNNGSFVDMALPVPSEPFLRGDANGDGTVNLADAIAILTVGFGLGSGPICELAADANDDGAYTPIADATTILGVLFLTGFPPLAAPYPDCGLDPFPAGLTCAVNDCL